ncbi:phosphopyruvate hydratase [Patescibacteria group bacterium]|nr:phosphopyruvate hydratase [Patescibacteria group bacterium]
MKSKIKSLKAKEILNSKGEPTVEVQLITDQGSFFSSVPSGTSTGKYEAAELRDRKERYQGKGVLKAVKNVNEVIAEKLQGQDVTEQKKIDQILIELDGTKNKSKLGANAILPVSIAVCRAGASANNLPLYQYIARVSNLTINLPSPCFLLIEGGLHAGNALSVQEFMISPKGNSFKEHLRIGVEIYHTLGSILEKEYGKPAINVGLEGGFTVPTLKYTKEPLDLILKAIQAAGYEEKVKILLDVAASSFYQDGVYQFDRENIMKNGLSSFYQKLFEKYPIFAIEDPFSEDDWEGWKMLKSEVESLKSEVLIIGDDLLTTNPERMKIAKEENLCNAAIIKPNQIGTVTETIEATKLAQSFDWKIMASHRSGETNDYFIADFAVGISADFIKAGAPIREKKERMAKYDRLLKIEEEI